MTAVSTGVVIDLLEVEHLYHRNGSKAARILIREDDAKDLCLSLANQLGWLVSE